MTFKNISSRLMKLEQQGATEKNNHTVHIYDPKSGLDKYLGSSPADADQVHIYIPDNGRGTNPGDAL